MAWTIEAMRKRSRECGRYFFSHEAMRTFHSRISGDVFEGAGGIYFVSSQQFIRELPREYTVNRFHPETGAVEVSPSLMRHDTLAAAKKVAKRTARGESVEW
jgi:CTP-dependent riboflavin kinase